MCPECAHQTGPQFSTSTYAMSPLAGKRYPFAEFKKALETSVAPGRSAESPKVFLES